MASGCTVWGEQGAATLEMEARVVEEVQAVMMMSDEFCSDWRILLAWPGVTAQRLHQKVCCTGAESTTRIRA